MANYKKPQSPLQHKDGDYFYPLTTLDQIVMEDNSRLNANLIRIDLSDNIITDISDEDCINAYLEYTNRKIRNFGLTSTQFFDASGLSNNNKTTPAELLKIGMIAASNSSSIKYWGGNVITDSNNNIIADNSVEVNIIGKDPIIIQDPLGTDIKGTRYVTKSGRVENNSGVYRAVFMISPINKKPYAFSVMVLGENYIMNLFSYVAYIKRLFEEMEGLTVDDAVLEEANTKLSEMVAAGGGYSAVALVDDISFYQQIPYVNLIKLLSYVNDGQDNILCPASTTKIVTLMNTLDLLNESDVITIKTSDLAAGSGKDVLSEGDQLYVSDALYLLMRQSNNTVANALARTMGIKLLKNRII